MNFPFIPDLAIVIIKYILRTNESLIYGIKSYRLLNIGVRRFFILRKKCIITNLPELESTHPTITMIILIPNFMTN